MIVLKFLKSSFCLKKWFLMILKTWKKLSKDLKNSVWLRTVLRSFKIIFLSQREVILFSKSFKKYEFSIKINRLHTEQGVSFKYLVVLLDFKVSCRKHLLSLKSKLLRFVIFAGTKALFGNNYTLNGKL